MKKIPLRCPVHKSRLINIENGYICSKKSCSHSNKNYKFPIYKDIPILISEIETDTVCLMKEDFSYVKRPFSNFTKLRNFLAGESQTTKINCDKFIKEIFKINKKPNVLVIGGGEKGSGTEFLFNNADIEIHVIDIYMTENVDVICDAHYLPMKKNYYDGVWIQAVLEHVVEPIKVVDEILRILKNKGIIYAETPFMQQVHEGAYDFTRYTVLGHRYLFKKFEAIDFGGDRGPEIVLAWSIKYLIWALFRNRMLSIILGYLTTIILRPFGFFIRKSSLYDSSSGVYFLGKKNTGYSLKHKELINLYKGQF